MKFCKECNENTVHLREKDKNCEAAVWHILLAVTHTFQVRNKVPSQDDIREKLHYLRKNNICMTTVEHDEGIVTQRTMIK